MGEIVMGEMVMALMVRIKVEQEALMVVKKLIDCLVKMKVETV